jgi:hypothetical protein
MPYYTHHLIPHSRKRAIRTEDEIRVHGLDLRTAVYFEHELLPIKVGPQKLVPEPYLDARKLFDLVQQRFVEIGPIDRVDTLLSSSESAFSHQYKVEKFHTSPLSPYG